MLDNVKNVVADVVLLGKKKGSIFCNLSGRGIYEERKPNGECSNMACSIRPCRLPIVAIDFFKEVIRWPTNTQECA